MKKLSKIMLVVAIFSMVMMGAAIEYNTITRTNGISANVLWVNLSADKTVSTFVTATKSDVGTDVFVDICNITTLEITCESGYKFTTENIFSASLNGALLNTDILLSSNQLVNVKAQWTGTGDIKNLNDTTIQYDGYTAKYTGVQFRQATAVGSINNIDLGATNYANLLTFKSVTITIN